MSQRRNFWILGSVGLFLLSPSIGHSDPAEALEKPPTFVGRSISSDIAGGKSWLTKTWEAALFNPQAGYTFGSQQHLGSVTIELFSRFRKLQGPMFRWGCGVAIGHGGFTPLASFTYALF